MEREDRRLVAVTANANPAYLKRHALLFDEFRLVSPSLHNRRARSVNELALARALGVQVSTPPHSEMQSPEAVELDWLQERGVVTDLADTDVLPRDLLERSGYLAQLRAAVRENRMARGRDGEAILDLFLSLQARGAAAVFREQNVDALAITDSVDDFQLPADAYDQVTSVVIENIPVPDEHTSWDDILAFKEDRRIRIFHAQLRNWIWQHSRGELTPHELAGEIEVETKRFELFMEQHGIGRLMTNLEMVIKAAAWGTVAGIGINEQAAVVGAVGSVAVTITKHRAQLLQAEMQAPGSELAFISKARERFGDR